MPATAQRVESSKNWAAAGTWKVPDTLRRMSKVVGDSLRMRPVVESAAALLRYVPGRNYSARAAFLRSWLNSHFIFTPDPHGVETLRTPDYMLSAIERQGWVAGDCDDAAILSAALGKAAGFPATFVALAFDPTGKRFRHVYTVLHGPAGEEYEMDFTRSNQALPPAVTGALTLKV